MDMLQKKCQQLRHIYGPELRAQGPIRAPDRDAVEWRWAYKRGLCPVHRIVSVDDLGPDPWPQMAIAARVADSALDVQRLYDGWLRDSACVNCGLREGQGPCRSRHGHAPAGRLWTALMGLGFEIQRFVRDYDEQVTYRQFLERRARRFHESLEEESPFARWFTKEDR